jgi:uncharacterized lipoprotein YddW (UPF0748 family)
MKLFLALTWRGRPAGFVASCSGRLAKPRAVWSAISCAVLLALLCTPAGASGIDPPADGIPPARLSATGLPAPESSKTGRLYLWVVRDALADTLSLAALADSAQALGCTDLLIQVRGRGDAYYRSSIEPAPRSLETPCPPGVLPGDRIARESLRFDPLAAACRIAQARGMRIHAWVNVFLSGNWRENGAQNAVVRHPEWVALLRDGRPPQRLRVSEREGARIEGIYLSPGNLDVRRHLERVVRDLLSRYPLDGLHLDYIRYPYGDAGYDEASREAFLIADLEESIPAGDDPRMSPWDRWRTEQVSLTVERLARTARSIRPGIEVTAAVIPDAGVARESCKQDWPRWAREGWIDAVLLMAYTPSTERLGQFLRSAREQIPEAGRVIPGLGLHKLEARSLEDELRLLDVEGVRSYALFSQAELMRSRSLRDTISRCRLAIGPRGQ